VIAADRMMVRNRPAETRDDLVAGALDFDPARQDGSEIAAV
jgi:hypothetical protein